jgi:hypothetical protein
MRMARTLSKSRFQKGLQCEKALWLSINRPDLKPPVPESQQWIFDQGSEVGRLAQGLFPGGLEVTEDHFHSAEALVTTRRLVAEGAAVLYEPAFEFDGAFARVDILVNVGAAGWDLYEVKSTASLKVQHISDAAVQAYAVEGSGLELRSINVVHLNTAYVYPGGEYDVSQLFTVEDVTQQARAFMPQIPEALRFLQCVLEGHQPPDVLIGSRCATPYDCDYAQYCRAFLPDRHPITELPRLQERQLHNLLSQGITCILDVPDDCLDLTASQRGVVHAVKSGEPIVDAAGLTRDLAGLRWPVAHLDFETVMPALPLWPGTRPYQTIPFQYSVHVQHEDGTLEHSEYLHAGVDDPRRPLAEHLVNDLAGEGSIVHYTNYENRILKELESAFPDLAPDLAALRTRLFDLEGIVRKRTTHPDARGRSSIKYALPAWCPDLSYDDLAIADGQTASVRYLRILKGLADNAEARTTLEDLETYCALDTLATVRLLEQLLARV